MKKLITLTIITLFFISCSNDDNPIDPIDQVNKEKSLIKMIQTRFNEGELDKKIIFIYKNNKLRMFSFYDSSDNLTGTTEWSYNSSNLLYSTKTYFPNGIISHESLLWYDKNEQIIKSDNVEDNGNSSYSIVFEHNDDNTITSTSFPIKDNSIKTFHVNEDGLIYKEVSSSNHTVGEVVYDGNNPLSFKSSHGTIVYSYDNVNLPKDYYLNLNKNIFGENKINRILWGNSLQDQVSSYSDKYLMKQEFSNGHIIENKYTFDVEGFPIKMKRYYNNELQDEMEYFYE